MSPRTEGTRLVIILEPLAAQRLEEEERPGETATETLTRITPLYGAAHRAIREWEVEHHPPKLAMLESGT